MSENDQEKPKIIVDDDWKSQVDAEKAAAEQLREAAANETDESDLPSNDEESADYGDMELPPASFTSLVSTLATQALASLGQFPGPDGKPHFEPGLAKHLIDTLAVLDEKTKGNLSADEMVMLNNVLHELRMAFVNANKAAPTGE